MTTANKPTPRIWEVHLSMVLALPDNKSTICLSNFRLEEGLADSFESAAMYALDLVPTIEVGPISKVDIWKILEVH